MYTHEKRQIRKLLLEKRDNTSADYLQIASQKIYHKLVGIREFLQASTVGVYYPIGSEVHTQQIIVHSIKSAKEVYLPVIHKNEMTFGKIKDLEDLRKGELGIMGPKKDATSTDRLDIILVPTVGVSQDGVRLGYGFGYYDRFLASSSTDIGTTISLALEKQVIMKGHIPKDEHDILMDMIITEESLFRTVRV